VTDSERSVRPGPQADPDSADFWDGLAGRQIRLQRCDTCGAVRCPPLPCCPLCRARTFTTLVASGRGRVYAWITVRRPIGTVVAEELPVTIATVELDEGPRLVGRLEGTDRPAADLSVEATYFRHADWTELRFTPAGDGD
jgi:uncharacterized OB-fold protein